MRELGVFANFFRVRTFQNLSKKNPRADFLKVRKDFKYSKERFPIN